MQGRVDSPECDSVTGRCNCLPGYTGVNCEDGITQAPYEIHYQKHAVIT